MSHHPHRRRWRRAGCWLVAGVGLLGVGPVVLIGLPDAAAAAQVVAATAQVAPLSEIIARLQLVITALLAGLATLFLTIAGVRYLFGAGDPTQIEKAKAGLRSAAIGYAIAALAGTLFALLAYIVGA